MHGAVPDQARLVVGNCGDPAILRSLLPIGERFDAVFHFAAFILVDESVREPLRYFENNVECSRRLIEYVIETKVPAFVFSSTAATYGEPTRDLIREDDIQSPVNPYGQTKLEVENILRKQFCQADSNTRFIALRYFNPAGAHSSLEIGQARPSATHIVNVGGRSGRRSPRKSDGLRDGLSDTGWNLLA